MGALAEYWVDGEPGRAFHIRRSTRLPPASSQTLQDGPGSALVSHEARLMWHDPGPQVSVARGLHLIEGGLEALPVAEHVGHRDVAAAEHQHHVV